LSDKNEFSGQIQIYCSDKTNISSNIMQKKAAISGATGFVGKYLSDWLRSHGYEVRGIPRDLLQGDPLDLTSVLEGSTLVIHLAGAPIIGRWTERYKRKIYDSRILTTRHLVDAMDRMEQPPSVFICASGVNIYPDNGVYTEEDTIISEEFLGEVCRDWELEAMRASAFTRVLNFRFGMVLGKGGGALKTISLPFRFGIGGKIGSGRQIMSWIHIEDLARAIDFAVNKKSMVGPLNICSPAPVSNNEFTRTLARVMRRPAIIPVPALAVRILYGEAATIITRGRAVLPQKLRRAGFQFRYPQIEEAFRDVFSR
jgi:uncharacterized protein